VKGCGAFVLTQSKDCSWFDKLTMNGMWLIKPVLAKSLRMWDDNLMGVNRKDGAR